jgi:dTDP-glucose 4,6-dehydratase
MEGRFLITGGAGFIGSNFVYYLLKKYPEVRIWVLDALTYAGNIDNLTPILSKEKRLIFIKGNIEDKELVSNLARNVDIIVHFAAETHVDRSILESGKFIQADVVGTFVLLEVARKYNLKFLHISTDEVYGEAKDKDRCDELYSLFPKSPYAASKTAADRLVYAYFCTYGLESVITRCVNNYGPYQHPEKMISFFITQALEDKPLFIYNKGENIREWIYVEDHCVALALLSEALLRGEERILGETFNIGTQEEYSIIQIARKILEILKKDESLLVFTKDRPGHVFRHAVNSSKLREFLGWQPQVNFSIGLEKTIEWYKENTDWWKKIKNSSSYREHYEAWYNKYLAKGNQ